MVVNDSKNLPNCLLSAPLRPDIASLLNERERRKYNIQKVKYETAQRAMAKQAIPPQDKVFNESEVASMVAGTYWSDSEDEDKPAHKKKVSMSDSDDETMINKLHRERLTFAVDLDQFDSEKKSGNLDRRKNRIISK